MLPVHNVNLVPGPSSPTAVRGASRVSTWIIGIAYRTALKSLRRNQTRLKAQNMADLADMTVDPTDEAEVRDWVGKGLNHLPLEQRLLEQQPDLQGRIGVDAIDGTLLWRVPLNTCLGRHAIRPLKTDGREQSLPRSHLCHRHVILPIARRPAE